MFGAYYFVYTYYLQITAALFYPISPWLYAFNITGSPLIILNAASMLTYMNTPTIGHSYYMNCVKIFNACVP